MKLRHSSAILCLFLFVLLPSCHEVPPNVEKLRVYGSPGIGQIQVRAIGSFYHPGIYWIPAGTKLSELVKTARINNSLRWINGAPAYILVQRQRNGKTTDARFIASEIATGESGAFVLEHRDVIQPDYPLLR